MTKLDKKKKHTAYMPHILCRDTANRIDFKMNRRNFFKVVTATAIAVGAPSFLIPADAKLVLDAKNKREIGNVVRTIDWHSDISAYYVNYRGCINNHEYYYGCFVEDDNKRTLLRCDDLAIQVFKRKTKIKDWLTYNKK